MPLLCTYRLNWARRTSWGWWDDTALQTRDSKFKPWRSEAEHATYRSRRSPTILSFTSGWGRNIFVFFSNRRDRETINRTLAWKAAVLTTTLEPPPSRFTNSSTKECCTGESSYWNTGRSWMFRCCPLMRKRAYKASYTIKKVTRFVYMYQLYIQLHHVMSDDLDIFCLIVTSN